MSKVSRKELKPGVVEAAGRSLPLRIRVDPRSRLMVIRLGHGGGEAKVTVPPGVTRSQAIRFARDHTGWLGSLLDRLGHPVAVRDGASVPLRGRPCGIVADMPPGSGAEEAAVDGLPVIRCQADRPGAAVEAFLRAEARTDIETHVRAFCAKLKATARGVLVKDTRSRWGSCTADGVLSVTWRAVMAPPPVLRYLVAHEVSHLVHFDHGPGFWACCARLDPGMDEAKRWLAAEGQRLQMYDFRTEG